MPSRATRRARLEAEKRRAARFFRDVWHESADPARVGRRAASRVSCSCWMCCNPRHAEKGAKRLTLQERRATLP